MGVTTPTNIEERARLHRGQEAGLPITKIRKAPVEQSEVETHRTGHACYLHKCG